jgi:hypothetical protein
LKREFNHKIVDKAGLLTVGQRQTTAKIRRANVSGRALHPRFEKTGLYGALLVNAQHAHTGSSIEKETPDFCPAFLNYI